MTLPAYPETWTKDFLSLYMNKCHENNVISHVSLDAYGTIVRIVDIFNLFIENSLNTKQILAVQFVPRCHSVFLASARSCTAGQLYESQPLMRACLENALYAFHIANKDGAERIWLERTNSSKTRTTCRNEFAWGKTLASLRTVAPKIADKCSILYDKTIDLGAHPNDQGLFQSIEIIRSDGRVNFETTYIHGNLEKISDHTRMLASIGTVCLLVFQLIFKERFMLLGINGKIEAIISQLKSE